MYGIICIYSFCFFLGTVLFERFIHDVVCSNSLFLLLYGHPLSCISQFILLLMCIWDISSLEVTVNNAAIIFLYVFFGTRMNGFLFVALLRLDLWGIYSNLGGPYKRKVF